MKILAVVCLLLPVLAFTATSSLSTQEFFNNKALLETNKNMDDINDGDLADIQGAFNVLAQVEVERKKLMKDTDVSAQFLFGAPSLLLKLFTSVGKSLWGVGKKFLRRRFCPRNLSYEANMLAYYGDKGDEAVGNDAKALDQLKALFAALKEVDANTVHSDDMDHAKAKVWWKKAKQWIKNKIAGVTRKFLC